MEIARSRYQNQSEYQSWLKVDRNTQDNKRSAKEAFEAFENAGHGMLQNIFNFAGQTFVQVKMDASEYGPHFQALLESIPAEAYHKAALGHLKMALKLNQENCRKITLKYSNPIRPSAAQTLRKRRDSEERDEEVEEPMSLSKLGKVISKWLTDAENTMLAYISESVPGLCQSTEAWFKQRIAEVEDMAPEEIKKKFNNR